MDVTNAVFLIHTAVLVVASLLLLYPVVAYAWNVAYTTELLLLMAAFLSLAGGYVGSMLFASAAPSNALDLVAASFAFAAVWRLATQVAHTGDDDAVVESTTERIEGGFRGRD